MSPAAKHTPGPWMLDGKTHLGWRIDGTTERSGVDFLEHPVAIVPDMADAVLIAAAPALADALEALLKVHGEPLDGQQEDAHAAAEAALRAAGRIA